MRGSTRRTLVDVAARSAVSRSLGRLVHRAHVEDLHASTRCAEPRGPKGNADAAGRAPGAANGRAGPRRSIDALYSLGYEKSLSRD